MVGGRGLALRHRAQHEVAAGDARQELREIVAHRQRSPEHARLVADEQTPHVEHRLRAVGFIHQWAGARTEVKAGANAESAVRLTGKTGPAPRRRYAKRTR